MDGGGLISLTDSSHLWKDQTVTMTSSSSISILVVDDDITCLAIVSAILKKFNYEGAFFLFFCMFFLGFFDGPFCLERKKK